MRPSASYSSIFTQVSRSLPSNQLLSHASIPGSSVGKISRAESIRHIADGINAAHLRTVGSGVKVVLENMSCQVRTQVGSSLV